DVVGPRLHDVAPSHLESLDLRVGRIVELEPFPEARSPALKVTVDFGSEIGHLRTSAQITSYAEAELLNRLVVGAINLGPKRIAGFRSEFLLLGAITREGSVSLLSPGETRHPATTSPDAGT